LHFFCLFAHFFFQTFHNILVHYPWNFDQKGVKSAKMRKKCEKCDANTKCECDAKKVRCNAMTFDKKCECECEAKKFCTTIPGRTPSFVPRAPFLKANIYATKYHQNSFLQFYIEIWHILWLAFCSFSFSQ
jgi:hypothetical protein